METTVVYGRCIRNHAAGIGLHATDGCQQFYPIPQAERALLCGACGCHRNFHQANRVVQPNQPLGDDGALPNEGPHYCDPREIREFVRNSRMKYVFRPGSSSYRPNDQGQS